MRVVIDSSVLVAALTTPNPESASRVLLAAVAAEVVELAITDDLIQLHAGIRAQARQALLVVSAAESKANARRGLTDDHHA